MADLTAGELESLKKVFNQSVTINQRMVKQAFANAPYPTVVYFIMELKQLIKKEN